jgi:hypothetical protein
LPALAALTEGGGLAGNGNILISRAEPAFLSGKKVSENQPIVVILYFSLRPVYSPDER